MARGRTRFATPLFSSFKLCRTGGPAVTLCFTYPLCELSAMRPDCKSFAMQLQRRCCTLRSEALHIPLDVAESIIDSLRYDRNALQACALTCRSWVHRSRTHLHRTFVIKHTGVALCSDSEVRRHISLRDLPCILEYADEVTLESVSGAENRDIGCCRFQFWDTVRRLRHIRKLTILGTELCGSAISLGGSCWDTLFPAVESLSLRGATVASARDILRLASSFRGLRTLDFDTVDQLASAGVESKAGFASSPDSIAMHIHPSDSFSTLNLAPWSIRFEHCHDKFIADILLSHLDSAQHAQVALQVLQLHTTLSIDESAPLEASVRAAVSLRDLHIVIQEQAEIPEFRSNLFPKTLQRASKWIDVCERLEVLRLSLRRQQLLAMISMVSPYHVKPYSLNTVWDVYGEILRGLSRPSFSELVLHVDASDIEQPGLRRLENSLSQHSALRTVKSVRFLVGGYFTSRERLHQNMERWSGNLRRLRTTHAVHIDFYRKLCSFSN